MPRPPRPEFNFDDLPQIDVASAVVLLFPNRRDAQGALRCALGGLALSGALRFEAIPGGGAFGLRDLPPGIILPPTLRAIHTLLHSQSGTPERAWTRTQLRLLLQAEFGVGYRRFIRAHVYPWLREKGLVEERELQVFAIIPATRFAPTAAGTAMQSRLRAAYNAATELPQLTQTDPRAAAVRMIELGPGLLLAPQSSATYRLMTEIMRSEGEKLDIEAVRKQSATQRTVWVDAMNPERLRTPEFLTRMDTALAAADLVDNAGS